MSHIQDFMDASKHEPIKQENLTHDSMSQKLWDSFATYLGKYARNEKRVKFADGNLSSSKNSVRRS